MVELEMFIGKIENFESLKASNQIDYFAYYLLIEKKNDGFVAKEISDCFDKLHLHPYSNIPSYLSSNLRGKNKKFIRKNENRYYIVRTYKALLDQMIRGTLLPSRVTSEFFPIELFDSTRGYLQALANQTLACYNEGIFDGCSVLSRKLVEILIIECFERSGVESLIKKSDGLFYYLSDLITEFLKEPKWNIGRNAKSGLPKIKKIGDLSAHNRRYLARKPDLDKVKDDFRIVVEELIHTIDYPNWKK